MSGRHLPSAKERKGFGAMARPAGAATAAAAGGAGDTTPRKPRPRAILGKPAAPAARRPASSNGSAGGGAGKGAAGAKGGAGGAAGVRGVLRKARGAGVPLSRTMDDTGAVKRDLPGRSAHRKPSAQANSHTSYAHAHPACPDLVVAA